MPRRPAGEYIHKVTVKRYTQAANDAGQLVPSAVDVCTAFARVATPSGDEITLKEGQQQLAINTVILCVIWTATTATIDPSMMVAHQGKTYELTAARDVTGRREEIQLDCIERVSQ